MPDAYWSEVAKAAEEARAASVYRLVVNRAKKHPYARQNKKRWPKGHREVKKALRYLGIPHIREYVIPLAGSSLFIVDFAMHEDKIFIEVDGPEHDLEKDLSRAERIHKIPKYADWTWIRLDHGSCYDRLYLQCKLGKYARRLDFLK